MKRNTTVFENGALGFALLAASACFNPAFGQCKNPANTNMIVSGPNCIEKFESSLWYVTDPAIIQLIKEDKVLVPTAGMTQVGLTGVDWLMGGCNINGGGCKNVFSLSFRKVVPARNVNYFVAGAACRNSGKRLLTNAEWQAAALGTPDPGLTDNKTTECNIGSSLDISLTGARTGCRSDVGAFDMIGNVLEFVADWGALATTGNKWDPAFGSDVSHVGGAPGGMYFGLPGATTRGGTYANGSGGNFGLAGAYAIDQNGTPMSFGDGTAAGFRCGY
ncbi:MAG: SUMF1/EgtB/PvdO family nonheme iron enzyme [Bryobacteraceae bacterium]|nr:SUMF1/EgtB/PvdO family nonheme iron enzyme [Bryobacteraceae bacterium]